mgnify:CR=1 FL=1
MDDKTVLDSDYTKDTKSKAAVFIQPYLSTENNIKFKPSKFEGLEEIDEVESLKSVYLCFHNAIKDKTIMDINTLITPESSQLNEYIKEVVTFLSDVCLSQSNNLKND